MTSVQPRKIVHMRGLLSALESQPRLPTGLGRVRCTACCKTRPCPPDECVDLTRRVSSEPPPLSYKLDAWLAQRTDQRLVEPEFCRCTGEPLPARWPDTTASMTKVKLASLPYDVAEPRPGVTSTGPPESVRRTGDSAPTRLLPVAESCTPPLPASGVVADDRVKLLRDARATALLAGPVGEGRSGSDDVASPVAVGSPLSAAVLVSSVASTPNPR